MTQARQTQPAPDGPQRVVFVHGVGMDSSMWDSVIPPIAEAGYACASVNLPGHGDEPASQAGTTLESLTDHVLGRVGHGDHLVGFSIGAFVAAALAAREPERVASLTLVSAVGQRTVEQRRLVEARLTSAREDFAATMRETTGRWFSPSWRKADPQLYERVLHRLLTIDMAAYLATYAVFAEADALVWGLLPTIQTPTLAVTGWQDVGSTPEMTLSIARRIPGAQGAVIPAARHLLPLEQPALLTAILLGHLQRTISIDPGNYRKW